MNIIYVNFRNKRIEITNHSIPILNNWSISIFSQPRTTVNLDWKKTLKNLWFHIRTLYLCEQIKGTSQSRWTKTYICWKLVTFSKLNCCGVSARSYWCTLLVTNSSERLRICSATVESAERDHYVPIKSDLSDFVKKTYWRSSHSNPTLILG